MQQTHIDWATLYGAFQLNTPEIACFLNLGDGTVQRISIHDPVNTRLRSSPLLYAPIENIPSRLQYDWVTEFLPNVPDEFLRQRLEITINGKGAFRRFKDILMNTPEERRRWFEFRDRKIRLRIVEWVMERGLRPNNPPPWDHDGNIELESSCVPTPIKKSNQVQHTHASETLKDFLIDWMERHAIKPISPIVIEALAFDLSQHFRISAS
jgi:hypothetical protein